MLKIANTFYQGVFTEKCDKHIISQKQKTFNKIVYNLRQTKEKNTRNRNDFGCLKIIVIISWRTEERDEHP